MAGNVLIAKMCTFLVSIVFWNVENCFDYFDGGSGESDREFSSFGSRHWTSKKFTKKTQDIGKTLLWAGSPDVIGFAEVENDYVLKRICGSAVLYKKAYSFVHYESHDRRGIDVALIYRSDSLALLRSKPIPILSPRSDNSGHRDTLKTRDILYVSLRHLRTGEVWHFFVNHHPSKYGGRSGSGSPSGASGRMAAMQTLLHNMDSLASVGESRIVAMGDFNDVPDGEAFGLLGQEWRNLGSETARTNTGSIRYRGNWELIDNFIVRDGRDKKEGGPRMEILKPSFLLERDRQWPGEKPRRCYTGPRYNGGISDHLPIRLVL